MSRAAAHELDTATTTEPASSANQPGDAPRSEALASTLAAIKDDARRDPEGYLARTVVPEGGE